MGLWTSRLLWRLCRDLHHPFGSFPQGVSEYPLRYFGIGDIRCLHWSLFSTCPLVDLHDRQWSWPRWLQPLWNRACLYMLATGCGSHYMWSPIWYAVKCLGVCSTSGHSWWFLLTITTTSRMHTFAIPYLVSWHTEVRPKPGQNMGL